MISADKVVQIARTWREMQGMGPIVTGREATAFRAQSISKHTAWLERINPDRAKTFRVQSAPQLRNAGSIFMEDLVRETIAEIFRFMYPSTRFANGELITIQGGARGAQAFQYMELDRTGLDPATGLVEGRSDQIEEVGLEGGRKLHEYATHMRAFSYSLDDLETAQFQGAFDLVAEKAQALRQQSDEDFESYIVNGVAGKWPSLFNVPGSLAVAATTGTWATATSAQIVGDVGGAIDIMRTQTNGMIEPDHVLFSMDDWGRLALPYGPEGSNSRIGLLRETYPFIRVWTWERHVPDGTAFFYRNDPNVVAARAPFRFEFLPPEATSARFRVISRDRLSGVYSKMPRGLLQLTGL